jgi:uncharacterized protein YndB with AHSA1/START domain
VFEAVELIRVEASPERVWAVVSDVESHPTLAGSGEVKAVRMSGPLDVGTTFEGDVVVGGVRSFTSRNVIEVADPPRELSWVSYPPLLEGETADHQTEVHWTFRLVPSASATDVEHTFRAPPPKANAQEWVALMERIDRVKTVREGMRQTLMNLKLAAESA